MAAPTPSKRTKGSQSRQEITVDAEEPKVSADAVSSLGTLPEGLSELRDSFLSPNDKLAWSLTEKRNLGRVIKPEHKPLLEAESIYQLFKDTFPKLGPEVLPNKYIHHCYIRII